MKTKRFPPIDFLAAACFLLVTTIVFRVTDLDITIQKHFFVPEHGWVYKDASICRFVYAYGPLPAIFLAVGSLMGLIGSLWIRRIMPYRKMFLFLLVLFLIGPGLVVNLMFKEHWGRPRPRTVDIFGGPQPFLYVWQKGNAGAGHSFASGHASMGFFLLAPYFVVRTRSKKWAFIFLAVGVSAGTCIGFIRMVQGGHFASDVLWAGGFIYLVGVALYYLFRLDRGIEAAQTLS